VHDISGTSEDSTKFPSEAQADTESHDQTGVKKPTLRLKLLLPFVKALYSGALHGAPEHVCSVDEDLPGATMLPNGSTEFRGNPNEIKGGTQTFYERDKSAERISVLLLRSNKTQYYVVVSHHHILRLIPSETVKERNTSHTDSVSIQWADWGPVSTRWFHSPGPAHYSSSYGAWVYFCNNMEEFINVHNLYPRSSSPLAPDMPASSLPEISQGAVVFCDFNQRLIKRRGSTHKPQPMPEGPSSTVHRSIDQSEDSPSSSSHFSSSKIIAQNVITEEWVLESPDFTEVVRSCLPFRVFIRKKLGDWIQCPTMGGNPFAVIVVSEIFSWPKLDQSALKWMETVLMVV
jgi:hypothetical protein